MKIILQKDLEARAELYSSLADFLNNENIIVYPTETIYGIGGIDTPVVHQKVVSAKMRAPKTPFIRVAGSWKLFEPYDFEINRFTQNVITNIWPGNLTLILYSKRDKCKIGVRVSDHPFIQNISPFLKAPLISSSANLSNSEYLNDFEIITESFSGVVEQFVEWKVDGSILPSTVAEIGESDVKIYREGVVKKEDIEKLI